MDQRHLARKVASQYLKFAGWWAIESADNPYIAPPPVNKGGLLNALPGVDPGSNQLYNGDGPADVMDDAFKAIDLMYRESWGRPVTRDELKAVFKFCSGGDSEKPLNLNKWLNDAVEISGKSQDFFMALDEDSKESLAKGYVHYRNIASPYAHSVEEEAQEAREEWESLVEGIVEDAIANAKTILGLQKTAFSSHDDSFSFDLSRVGSSWVVTLRKIGNLPSFGMKSSYKGTTPLQALQLMLKDLENNGLV